MLDFLTRFDFLQRFFHRESSSQAARNRLQLVLIHDRAQVAPEMMEALRHDMIRLISRYMIIDEAAMSVALERREGAVALAANIPVINIRRTQPEMDSGRSASPVATLETDTETETAQTNSRPGTSAADARRSRMLKRKREAWRRKRTS